MIELMAMVATIYYAETTIVQATAEPSCIMS